MGTFFVLNQNNDSRPDKMTCTSEIPITGKRVRRGIKNKEKTINLYYNNVNRISSKREFQ